MKSSLQKCLASSTRKPSSTRGWYCETCCRRDDFGIQGIPHEEGEQGEEKRRKQYIGIFVGAIMNHENKDALIAELQSKHP